MKVRDMSLRIVAVNDINNELDEKRDRIVDTADPGADPRNHEFHYADHLLERYVAENGRFDEREGAGRDRSDRFNRQRIDRVRGVLSACDSDSGAAAGRLRPAFLERIVTLIRHDTADRALDIRIGVEPEELLLYADEDMIGQVVLNLLKKCGSRFARPDGRGDPDCGDGQRIRRNHAFGDGQRMRYPPEVAANIFMPFFTTKENGSGIGLSVSRQIMRLHNGSISLKCSRPGETTFKLLFS